MLPCVASFQWLHVHAGHTKAAEKILAAPEVSTSWQLQPEICGRQGHVRGIRIEISWVRRSISMRRPSYLLPAVWNRKLGLALLSLSGHLTVHFCFISVIHCDVAEEIKLKRWLHWSTLTNFALVKSSFHYIKRSNKQGQGKFKESKAKQLKIWETIAFRKKGEKMSKNY